MTEVRELLRWILARGTIGLCDTVFDFRMAVVSIDTKGMAATCA